MQSYNQIVNKSPILAQCIMAGTTSMIGDFIAQKVTPYLIYKYQNYNKQTPEKYQSQPYDVDRTLKFGFFGAFYFGPLCSLWLRQLDKWIPNTVKNAAMKKLAIDRSLWSPSITFGFLMSNGLVEMRGKFNKSLALAKDQFWPVMQKGWPFWLSVMALNFHFVPLNFRLLNMQMAAIIWNTFLSWYTTITAEKMKMKSG